MKSFQYFTLSILTHFCIVGLLKLIPAQWPSTMPTEVEIIYETEPKQEKLFVQQTDMERLQQAIKKLEKQTRFLSKETRRVEKQQIARKSGKTQNQQPQPRQQSRQQDNFERPPLTGPGPTDRIRKETRYERNARISESTISEHIPEIRTGGFTSLNTDQFLYYTFYSRINEQLRNRWIINLRNFMDSYSAAYIHRLSYKPQMTEVEILLDPTGKFVKSIIHQKSESESLDQAAIQAFVLAQPFNNPPEEIIADDGYIHLRYGFYVHLKPRYLANGKK